jgi:nicotinamide riboside kinase
MAVQMMDGSPQTRASSENFTAKISTKKIRSNSIQFNSIQSRILIDIALSSLRIWHALYFGHQHAVVLTLVKTEMFCLIIKL